MVPERLRLMESWKLTYSLEQDGASLITLYQRARMYENKRVGFVLVVKDQEGGVSSSQVADSDTYSSSERQPYGRAEADHTTTTTHIGLWSIFV